MDIALGCSYRPRRPDTPCAELFDRVEETLGLVEILVNNAAYSRPDTFLPDERGMLEFTVNDKTPENNGGQFTIKVKYKGIKKK